MTQPIKIGLLGAPRSGKSVVARRIAARLNREARTKWMSENPQALKQDVPTKIWDVIDGYMETLSTRTGRTFGEIYNRAAFPLNWQVIAERWTREDAETTKGINTISCGTVYDTMVYAYAQAIPITHMSDEQLIMEESYVSKILIESIRVGAAIRFDYDLLFYLPLDEDEKGHDWATVVDDKLSEVLAGQNLTAIVLDGTTQQKVKRGTQIIREWQTAAASTDDVQHAIRERNEVGDGQKLESEPVSDVPSGEAADSPEGTEHTGMGE